MPQNEARSSAQDLKRNVNIVLGLARIMAFPVEVWTTRVGTWGSRYLTVAAVLGSVWPLFFAAFYGPDPMIGEVYGFWALTLCLLLIHRVTGLSRRSHGYQCHSRFRGYSWLTRGPGLRSQREARYAEDFLALAFGWVLIHAGSAPLGTLFLVGSVAKFMIDLMEFQAVESRLQQMEDARISNEFYADEYRKRQR